MDQRLQKGNKGKEENGVSFFIKPHFLIYPFSILELLDANFSQEIVMSLAVLDHQAI